MRAFLFVFSVAVAAWTIAESVDANPVFTANIVVPGVVGQGVSESQTSASAVSLTAFLDGSFDQTAPSFVTGNIAEAGPGGLLKGLSDVQFGCGTCSGGSVEAREDSSFSLDDFVVTGLPGTTPSSTVNVSLNLELSGGMALETEAGTGGLLSAQLVFNEAGPAGSLFFDSLGAINVSSGAGIFGATGLFEGFPVELRPSCAASPEKTTVDFATPSFQVAVGRPFGILLHFYTDATVSGSENSCGEALADFAHTVTFTPNGPVANLPDGYTLTSVEDSIVDNRIAITAVPEPPTLSILSAGLIVLVFFGLLRRNGARRMPPEGGAAVSGA